MNAATNTCSAVSRIHNRELILRRVLKRAAKNAMNSAIQDAEDLYQHDQDEQMRLKVRILVLVDEAKVSYDTIESELSFGFFFGDQLLQLRGLLGVAEPKLWNEIEKALS